MLLFYDISHTDEHVFAYGLRRGNGGYDRSDTDCDRRKIAYLVEEIDGRYRRASAMCGGEMRCSCARSAMVRATLITRL